MAVDIVLKPTDVPNVNQVHFEARITVIKCCDIDFWKHAEKTFPQNPATQQAFKDNPAGSQIAAFRNGSLLEAYFIIASRALELDCGPMSGFNNTLVDEEFLPAQHLDKISCVTLVTEAWAERLSARHSISSMRSARFSNPHTSSIAK